MMKSVVLALALFVVATYATDCTSWKDWFDQETDTCRPLCEEPPKPTKPTKPTTTTTTALPAVPTTVGEVKTTTGDYSIVTEGYTPTPGECVCVSGSTVSEASSSAYAESSSTPASSSILPLVSTTEFVAGSTAEEWHSHCILIEVFYNFTILFEGELQIIWLNFVEQCEKDHLCRRMVHGRSQVHQMCLRIEGAVRSIRRNQNHFAIPMGCSMGLCYRSVHRRRQRPIRIHWRHD
ncbi:hypothetical protein M3Y94_00612500 [Aphelenchoides besseyi]|nr:hypothetical protein M3Y94_00612500 [Aphelenchoides besseyi]